MPNILICSTGSVATIKVPLIVNILKQYPNVNVKVVLTEAAYFFVKDEKIDCEVYTDKDEWGSWKKVSDPILHIELRSWADIMVIAPLDANTLGKIANGLCDNLLTCILRAWNVLKPVIVCPSMNTGMWTHPFTARHLDILTTVLKFQIVQPISKRLACGDTGMGAMAEPQFIVDYTLSLLNKQTI